MDTFDANINDFLAQKRIAVAGVSRHDDRHPVGNLIYQRLKKMGHEVFAVNPRMTIFEGDRCYPDVAAIPGGVDGVVIITRPPITEQIVKQCEAAGVRRVWMHQSLAKGSSVSPAAVEYCRQHDISVIAGGCPMMYGPGADLGHRCMRWILRLTKSVPAAAVLLLLGGPIAAPATAQERPAVTAEFLAGWMGFPDEGIVNEGIVGAAARWSLLPRVGVGPELVYIRGNNHSHVVVTGNVTFDLLSPKPGRRTFVTPFIVAGGGIWRTNESFFTGPYSSSEGAFTAGGGFRALANDRISLGVDARIGWETHLRVNGVVGVRLGH